MANPKGIIHVLIHIPVVDVSSTLKLFKHIQTPIRSRNYPISIDDRAEPKYLAIIQDATLDTTSRNLEQCFAMRDTYICNDISILIKVGKAGGCLIDLYMNELERAKLTCNFRVMPNKDIVIRLNNNKIYISFANKTVLTEICLGKTAVKNGS